VSVAWSAGSGVNRYFADESLPGRLSSALWSFSRRDPRSWRSLAVNLGLLGAGMLCFYLTSPYRDGPGVRENLAVISFGMYALMSVASYLVWECSTLVRVRSLVARQTPAGALLTSSFSPRALRVTTPDMSYEIPYASVTRAVRFGDVLVIRSTNDLVMALPMELVPPQGLTLLTGKGAGGPLREPSYS
jgi:hypothetical protein